MMVLACFSSVVLLLFLLCIQAFHIKFPARSLSTLKLKHTSNPLFRVTTRLRLAEDSDEILSEHIDSFSESDIKLTGDPNIDSRYGYLPDTPVVYISPLPEDCTTNELDTFVKIKGVSGHITRFIPAGEDAGAFGCLDFEDPDEAYHAVELLKGTQYKGWRLNVNYRRIFQGADVIIHYLDQSFTKESIARLIQDSLGRPVAMRLTPFYGPGKRFLGRCLVEFTNEECVEDVYDALNKEYVEGHILKVEIVTPKWSSPSRVYPKSRHDFSRYGEEGKFYLRNVDKPDPLIIKTRNFSLDD